MKENRFRWSCCDRRANFFAVKVSMEINIERGEIKTKEKVNKQNRIENDRKISGVTKSEMENRPCVGPRYIYIYIIIY